MDLKELAKKVEELIAYPTEADWFEFKTNWYEANGIGEYISSLSNAAALEGQEFGYLVWGIHNVTHEIVGTTFDFRVDVKNEPLEHYLARQVMPDTNFRFQEITMEDNRIVVLIVPAASKIPTGFGGNRFIRIGSSKVNLNRYPERESYLFHILRVGLPTICNMESEYQDLTFEKLFVYYASKGISLNKRTFKKNLGLLTENGKYNLLAQLVSDNSHIPIRFAIFNGKDKASTMYSVREFGNTCLLLSLDKVLEYGDVLNVPQADERGRKVQRREISLFDEDAYREAIINAFVHNQWVSGNAPMITVFNDRIEILSRGTIPPGQTLEGFYAGESVPVNQKLSDMLLQLHISERTGRGVPKITEIYGKETYEFRENSIVVSIPFTKVNLEEMTPDETEMTPDEAEMTPDKAKMTPDEAEMTPDKAKMTPDEVGMPPVDATKKTKSVEEILQFCLTPKGILEIADYLNLKEKKSARRHIKPLLESGRLAMTLPDRPNSKNQKYITIK